MLVPEVAAGAALDLAPVRAACDAALATVLAARPDEIVVVGPGAGRRRWAPGDHGSFAGYGLEVPVSFGPATGTRFSDLSLLVAAWLLERATGAPYPATGYTLPAGAGAAECRAVGRQLAGYEGARRVALLAMGDAAGCRAEGVPEATDPVADEFDERAAAALGSGDPARLAALDGELAGRVGAAGWVSWQVLAGALAGRRWRAELLYSEIPLEVRYLVAAWRSA
jgi:hypothetical protein